LRDSAVTRRQSARIFCDRVAVQNVIHMVPQVEHVVFHQELERHGCVVTDAAGRVHLPEGMRRHSSRIFGDRVAAPNVIHMMPRVEHVVFNSIKSRTEV